MRQPRFGDVEASEQLLYMKFAAEQEPAPFMTNGEKAARTLLKENPAKFYEIMESLERAHWAKVMEYHRRLDEEEARQRAEQQAQGVVTAETTVDYGSEKVLEKLRELKEMAEG